MIRLRSLATALCLALLAALPVAQAAQVESLLASPPAVPATGLRMQLRVVDACRLPAGASAAACTTVHQRSDAAAPPPPQVQALTPPLDGGQKQRAWQTITF